MARGGGGAGVTSRYVPHHLRRDDLPSALRELRRVLRPGGGLTRAGPAGTRASPTRP
jgi:predicted SAM-dependent methyltransferase